MIFYGTRAQLTQLQLELHNLPHKTDSFRDISQFYYRGSFEILIAIIISHLTSCCCALLKGGIFQLLILISNFFVTIKIGLRTAWQMSNCQFQSIELLLHCKQYSVVCCHLCRLKFVYLLFIRIKPLKLRIRFFSVHQSSYYRALWSMIQGNQIQNYLYWFYRFYRNKIKMIIGLSR